MRSISVGKNLKWLCLILAIVVSLPDIAAADEMDNDDSFEASFCETNLTNILPPPYNKMPNLACERVWKSYIIRYSQTKDRVLTVILSTLYTTGWVGIGFSKDGLMIGSSAMVGWIDKQGVPRIKQYYMQGKNAKNVIANKGELQLTNVTEAVAFHEATIYLAFQIKLEKPRAKQNVLLAFGSKYPTRNFHLTLHDDRTSLKMDFASGNARRHYSATSGSGEVVPEATLQQKTTHGLLGILGWGLFLPVGTIIARYFRHKDPLWFYLHIVIQFIGYLLLLANSLSGMMLWSFKDNTQFSHKALGIFAISHANLQVMALCIRPGKESKFRKYWNWFHQWVGRLTLFYGMVNIMLGIQIGDGRNEWKIGYGFLLCAILVTVALLEILALVGRREASKATESPPT